MRKKKVIKPEDMFEKGVYKSVIEYIKENIKPEDLFDEDTLETWAYKNDFVQRKMVKEFYSREEARSI